MNVAWWACMVASALSAVALAALLAVYVRNLRAAPSAFGRGLVAFASLFLVEALGFLAVWAPLQHQYDLAFGAPMAGLRALEAAGAGVLLWVSWE